MVTAARAPGRLAYTVLAAADPLWMPDPSPRIAESLSANRLASVQDGDARTGTETGTSKTVLVMDMEATAAAKALYLPLPGLFAFVRPLTYLGSPSLDACYHVL